MKKNIIDTHIHIWDLHRVRYTWLEGDTSVLNRTYLLEELIPQMHQTPVVSGLLVQAANNLEDTELMLETARKHKEIAGVVGWLPLTEPDNTIRLLEERFSKELYFKGVRHLIHNEPDTNWLLQDTVIKSLKYLAECNIPFDIVGVNDDHLKTAIALSHRIPSLKLVLDHLNQPPINSGERFGSWGKLMREISGNKNVFAKISGLGTASGNFTGWAQKDISPYIGYALETFGVERCFCGGDWPVSTLAGSYTHHWEKYTETIDNLLSEADAAAVYHKNASLFYQLPLNETIT